MNYYHYKESGLDNVILDDGFKVEHHKNYGETVRIDNVRGLHDAIGRWLVELPRTLHGSEFRFLRTELDMSQRMLGRVLGVTEQAIAKWEKARNNPVSNKSADRLLRLAYINYVEGKPEFSEVIDRLTQLDAEISHLKLHLKKTDNDWKVAA